MFHFFCPCVPSFLNFQVVIGSVIINVVPLPSSLSTWNVPPCPLVMISKLSDKPNPVPSPCWFSREEWLEYLFHAKWRNTRSVVFYADLRGSFLKRVARSRQSTDTPLLPDFFLCSLHKMHCSAIQNHPVDILLYTIAVGGKSDPEKIQADIETKDLCPHPWNAKWRYSSDNLFRSAIVFSEDPCPAV